jgi:HK97 family phage portal protein
MSGLTSFTNPATWLLDWVRGSWGDSESSERNVSAEQALSYAPIWYGVNKIAGHIAQLPVSVYRRVDGGGEKLRGHQVSKLLRKPNSYQISSVFREQLGCHSLLEGNGRAAIVRAGSRPVELIPLDPDCTVTGMVAGVKLHATRPAKDDRLRQFFSDIDGEIGEGAGNTIMLDDADVVHILGLSNNGVTGLPLRKVGKRNLNAAINTEKRFAKSMDQGFSGSLMLEAPPGMFRSEDDAKKFIAHFEERHNSPDKAGKPGLLTEGMKANILQSSNADNEMTDNRKFQRQDAALWLGLEQILGDDSSVSYNSLEQKNLAYLMNCLNRWLKRWEEELESKLLPSREFERDTHYIRFNTAALLKSDYQTSVQSLSDAISATILSPNEARQKLDMLPRDGGDIYQNPNTSSGNSDPQSEPVESESSEEPEDESETRAELAALSRLEHLVGVEANKVKQAAVKAAEDGKNFVEWVDGFYGKWEGKLAGWLEEMGLDRDAATEHCEDSKQRLLEVCDYSNATNLADNVSKQCGNWKTRARMMINV